MKKRILATAIASIVIAGGSLGVAEAARDNTNNDHGICTAYFNGKKTGHEQGNSPGPFGALEDANDDDIQAIYDFCSTVVGNGGGNGEQGGDDGIGGKPEDNGRFTDCFTDANNDPSDDCTDGAPAA